MADLSAISKNAKKIKEQIAQQAGVETKDVNDKNLSQVSAALDGAKKVASEGGDPTKTDVGELKEIAGVKSGSEEDLSKQRKIAMAITAIMPTLVGYSFGGAEGGAIGAKTSTDALAAFNKQDAEADKNKRDFAEKKELKGLELAQKQEEAKLRHEDKKGDQEIRKMTAQALLDEKNQKKTDAKSIEGRLAKLNSGDKARFDNSKLGLEYTQQMDAALASGDNTFSVVGDNNFTNSLALAAEAFGRMQSGGAINHQEEARFMKMSPTKTDSVPIQRQKLQNMQKLFADRLHTLGFTPDETGLPLKEMAYGAAKKPEAGITNPATPAANAADQKPDFDNMTEEQLKKYLGKK